MIRDKRVDILKAIGIICIIIAHVIPASNCLNQIRGFDVVLMIICSCFLFYEKEVKIIGLKDYFKYFLSRVERLVLPTWIFISVFFIVLLLLSVNKYSVLQIIKSYLFTTSGNIGYVWIIRIYLLTALLLPIFMIMIKKLGVKKTSFIITILYIAYEVLCDFGVFSNLYLEYFFAFVCPLLLIILFSYYMFKTTNKKRLLISFVFFSIFLLLAYVYYIKTGEYKNTYYMKYPFRMYYLSYCFACSSLFFVILDNDKITSFLHNKLVLFISKNSLWIYLWHIAFLYPLSNVNIHTVFKFAIVFSGSLFITFIQSLIVKSLEKKFGKNRFLKIFKG